MHVFTLTDGSVENTIDLNDGLYVWATGYTLDTPGGDATEATDSLDLLFIDVDNSLLIRRIEAMLGRATLRQKTRRGPRIYLTVELTGDDQEWRAEVYQGALVAEKAIDDTYKGTTRATLVVQRAPFWEGEEVELPLRNYTLVEGEDGPVTGGVAVPNDPAVGCWVQIDADTVMGALPAPIRIRLTNDAVEEWHLRHLRIGINSYIDDIEINPVIQAEDAIFSDGTTTLDLTSGGGFWTSESFTTATMLNQWELPEGMTEASQGRWWWLLARVLFSYTVSTPPALWPVILEEDGLLPLWTGEQVRQRPSIATLELLDFGPVPIPPGAFDDTPSPVRLAVFGEAAASETMAFDYFYLFPMDSFRRVDQTAMSVRTNEFVEIDEIERRYSLGAASGRVQLQTVAGTTLVVVPGRAQRIHLLYNSNFSMPIQRFATVRVWYRPRRLTL